MIKITKVNRIIDENLNMDGLEVELDKDGTMQRLCFTDAKEALELEDGEEHFKKVIREHFNKEAQLEKKKEVKELKEYKDKVI